MDDLGIVRPERAASTQPRVTPWVGMHKTNLRPERAAKLKYEVNNLAALIGRRIVVSHITQGDALGYIHLPFQGASSLRRYSAPAVPLTINYRFL